MKVLKRHYRWTGILPPAKRLVRVTELVRYEGEGDGNGGDGSRRDNSSDAAGGRRVSVG